MRFSVAFALLLTSASSVRAITIDTVPVGNPGNTNDPATGNLYGGVGYAYSIGKHEVTVGQYAAFLNAVASTDTYGLYNYVDEIVRNGTSGTYTYSVTGSQNHPVTFVLWGNAARFANWLHNSQPVGVQDASTTEDGAYTLNGATSSTALKFVTRNATAKWFIPSENEWYKSAYYQPASLGGDSDNYWEYPMRTNSIPYSDQPPGDAPDNTRVGNFYNHDGVANGYDDGYAIPGQLFPNYIHLTDVWAYTSSPSYYGTFDQGGNVWEWNESLISVSSQTFRGFRGGSWSEHANYLQSSIRFIVTVGAPPTGFRVASIAIPEPSAFILAITAVSFLSVRRGKRASRNRV